MRDLQNKRLRAIIKSSYDHVPYYHALFNKVNLSPDDIQTVEDLPKIPVSRKKDLRDLPIKDITANNVDLNTCEEKLTSGSSGIRFHVYRDKKELLSQNLSHYLWQLKCGDKLTNKRVVLEACSTRLLPPWVQKLGIFRTKTISTVSPPQTQLKEIEDYGARTLLGVPSSFLLLAKEIVEADYKGLDVDYIFTSAEFLPERTRKFIDETFKAQHFRGYGATECGRIGEECVEHRYHTIGTLCLEMTRDGEPVSPGEEGEVTVTNLVEYAQPFIRYDLEDLGMLFGDACSCGSSFPSLKPTWGRMSDFIHLPDGRAVSAHLVNSPILTNPLFDQTVKQYQVIQDAVDHLTVKLVIAKGFQEALIPEIKASYAKNLGDAVDIDVIIVEDIPREKSGKLNLFKTNIPTT